MTANPYAIYGYVVGPEGMYAMTPWGYFPATDLEGGSNSDLERDLFVAMRSVRDDLPLLEYLGLAEEALLRKYIKKALPIIEEYVNARLGEHEGSSGGAGQAAPSSCAA